MNQPSLSLRRFVRPGGPGGRQGAVRRLLAIPALGVLTAAALMLAPALASADSASTLTVVGTSDVSDSGLIPTLIQPEFHAAFPQFTFKYVGTATGTAITDAETGVNTPSVLIVHAASIENQFVASGFSEEPFGRAIFRNDFVLAGPPADPASVTTNAANNIAQAFADVATAGINGGGTPLATFVARDSNSGTSVAEHAIWALVGSMANPPAGLTLCTVSNALGGGETPVTSTSVPSSGAPCPGGGNLGLPPSTDFPSWYLGTTTGQGPTVITANACTGVSSPASSCYVFTDRGTFDYLSSGTSAAAGATGIPGLTILTRNNSATAPGGADELINYFHAYIINPATCTACGVNLTAATDFVNFITSPAVQAQLKTYLDGSPSTNDTGGPPFVADASPIITAAGFPATETRGEPVTVTGSLSNAEVGYPVLANQPVTVDEIEAGLPVPVASGTTNSTGNYSISFVPTSSGSYQVSTGQITQIENAGLSPIYGDMLSPSATTAVSMSVQGTVSVSSANPSPGGVVVSGKVLPAATDANARVSILARPQGSTGAFTDVGSASLAAAQSSYVVNGGLRAGKWQIEASYQDPGEVLGSTSGARNVTVAAGPAASTVGFKKLTVKKGALTVTGTVGPAPIASGAKVELFALRTVTVKVAGAKTKKTARKASIEARKTSVAFPQIAKTSVGTGKTKFTIKAKLKRGFRWVLELEYVQKGQKSSFSKLSSIDVH